ncbi:MAG TPA: RNA 2',3'-cyclic phosphodiesterase [Candidatus Dormibacteraeota bacterium]|nr:RNA 2',3'-cyclic phosphodiesterase [Candidatus Dormibacteraeota bacterium]
MRAFLAVPVVTPALEPFTALRERLIAAVDAVRWVPAESPHITLHFFGAIDDAAARRALAAVTPALAGHAPLRLRLRGLGAFPSQRHPRVLWWGVDGDLVALHALAAACQAALSAAGFVVEARPWHPHCTLGRPGHPWPGHAVRSWLALGREAPATPLFSADRAVLYESVRGPDGVSHHARAWLALGGEAASTPVG